MVEAKWASAADACLDEELGSRPRAPTGAVRPRFRKSGRRCAELVRRNESNAPLRQVATCRIDPAVSARPLLRHAARAAAGLDKSAALEQISRPRGSETVGPPQCDSGRRRGRRRDGASASKSGCTEQTTVTLVPAADEREQASALASRARLEAAPFRPLRERRAPRAGSRLLGTTEVAEVWPRRRCPSPRAPSGTEGGYRTARPESAWGFRHRRSGFPTGIVNRAGAHCAGAADSHREA